MSALFPRIKVWIANETLTAADLNAEFNNILNNLGLDEIGPYSTSVPLFQETFDPGDVGTENLPSTAMEELQAERFLIQAITGEDEWYVPPGESLASLAAIVGASSYANRIISGAVDGNEQPQHLVAPGGTSFDLALNGNPTSFRYVVDGAQYTISADLTLDMTAAAGPSGAASEATFSDSYNTGAFNKILGEMPGTTIAVGSVGAGWTSRADKLSAFKFVNGSTEYFLGIYRSGGYIENCQRGYFFNSAGTNGRVQMAGAEVITILQLSYIFAKTDGTIVRNSSNNEPIVSGTEPTAPSAGDFWYDLDAQIWKQYSGSAWAAANVTFIGLCAQSSVACEATRSSDWFQNYSPLCDVSPQVMNDGVTVKEHRPGGVISAYGSTLALSQSQLSWSMATDLDTGVVEAASTVYYLYLSNTFGPKISDVPPHDRQQDLKGHYHPSKPWRCIGYVANNDVSALIAPAHALGGSSYLSRGSVSTDRLMPYMSANSIFGGAAGLDIQTVQNQVVQSTTDSLSAAGSDWDITVITSGRPLILNFVGDINADAADINVTLEYRGAAAGGAYTPIETRTYSTGVDPAQFAGFMTVAFLPSGNYNIRITISVNTAGNSWLVNGFLRAFEI